MDDKLKAAANRGEQATVPLEPTKAMIEAGAQRLVRWEDGSRWPDSWTPLQVAAARNEAERVWRSMVLEAPPPAKHRWWGAGEPDCPKDIKAGNGELHTLRCKVCGTSAPDAPCMVAAPQAEAGEVDAFALAALVAVGLVSQAKVDEARKLYPGPLDADATKPGALAALAQPAALAGEWRDIASAPRDCTAIIATDGKEVRMSFTANGLFFSGFQSNPTHWMPLPAALDHARGLRL